jgi:selenocysteine lyase/cysteine desulfurase
VRDATGDGDDGDAYVNLSKFLLAAHPPRVQAAIERHRRGLDGDTALYLRESEVELEEAARTATADYLGAKPDEIALTDSTTMWVHSSSGVKLPLLPASTIVDRLREEHRIVASVTPYIWQYVRFGPSVANSEDDVDQALEAVAAVVA